MKILLTLFTRSSAIVRLAALIVAIITVVPFTGCAQSKIELTIRGHDKDTSLKVDRTITDLKIWNEVGDTAYSIEGLEKLPNLKRLEISLWGRLLNFSFLSNLNRLQILIISKCNAAQSLPPIKWFPDLRQYVIHNLASVSDDPSSYSFDLSAAPRLEYLQVTGCRLIALPTIKNPPKTLRYVNFSQNEIASVKGKLFVLDALKNVKYVFLDYNHIPADEVKAYPNVRLDGMFDLLPKELMYTY